MSLNTYVLTSKRYMSNPPPKLAEIDADEITIEKAQNLKPVPKNEDLKFGKEFTDHMLEVDWDNTYGWHAPKIRPYAPFLIDPAASVLHYALEAFEGNFFVFVF